MTELKINWNKKSVKRAFAAFLAAAVFAAGIQITPITLFAATTSTVTTAGNATTPSNGTTETVTPGQGTETTAGNGTSSTTDTTDAATSSDTDTTVTIASVTLSKTSYTYNGKVKKPSVTVKDSEGNTIDASNYKVTYSNNKSVGKATVKVTATGSATGSASATFKINPAKTTISKIVATSKGFKVTWKKNTTQTTGYQIRYSTTSKFTSGKTTTVKLAKNTTTSKTVSKLSAKKKYYVQVRTYKTVNGSTYYSAWSDSIIVTTKK